jgi:hypothetical protein
MEEKEEGAYRKREWGQERRVRKNRRGGAGERGANEEEKEEQRGRARDDNTAVVGAVAGNTHTHIHT